MKLQLQFDYCHDYFWLLSNKTKQGNKVSEETSTTDKKDSLI